MNIIALMAATLLTVGITTTGEVWNQPPPPAAIQAAAPVAAEAPVAACVTIGLTHTIDRSVDETTGEWQSFPFIKPDPHHQWAYTGDWDGHTIQAAVIDRWLNYAFDQRGVGSYDMVFEAAIDVSGMDTVTVCR